MAFHGFPKTLILCGFFGFGFSFFIMLFHADVGKLWAKQTPERHFYTRGIFMP